MSTTKRILPGKEITSFREDDAIAPRSMIPNALRFPLVVISSLTLSVVLYSFSSAYTTTSLASISNKYNGSKELGVLLGWRAIQLGFGWFGDYDGYDLAALSLLSYGPSLYLLNSFYEISATTIGSSLLIDILTVYIPFRLLRPLSPAHSASASTPIAKSIDIQVYTTVLAGIIYSLAIYISYVLFLPEYLVTYFSDLPTIEVAHRATYLTLLPVTLIFGAAIRSFIFTPAVDAVPTRAELEAAKFDPETATLGETLWWNIWGFEKRTKVVIKRTVVLMLISGVNTFVQCYWTIRGVEAKGAAVYSGVWVVAAGVTGAALGFVGAA
jgi:hypothetical protein